MISDVMASAYCDGCNTLFRLERTQLTGKLGPFVFCPLCGHRGISLHPDITPDEYWQILAKEHGMPAELMQEIFQTWDTSQHHTLREHIDALRKDAMEIA